MSIWVILVMNFLVSILFCGSWVIEGMGDQKHNHHDIAHAPHLLVAA